MNSQIGHQRTTARVNNKQPVNIHKPLLDEKDSALIKSAIFPLKRDAESSPRRENGIDQKFQVYGIAPRHVKKSPLRMSQDVAHMYNRSKI